jgi:hypothetical protein
MNTVTFDARLELYHDIMDHVPPYEAALRAVDYVGCFRKSGLTGHLIPRIRDTFDELPGALVDSPRPVIAVEHYTSAPRTPTTGDQTGPPQPRAVVVVRAPWLGVSPDGPFRKDFTDKGWIWEPAEQVPW